jgi:hypothetical protein
VTSSPSYRSSSRTCSSLRKSSPDALPDQRCYCHRIHLLPLRRTHGQKEKAGCRHLRSVYLRGYGNHLLLRVVTWTQDQMDSILFHKTSPGSRKGTFVALPMGTVLKDHGKNGYDIQVFRREKSLITWKNRGVPIPVTPGAFLCHSQKRAL